MTAAPPKRARWSEGFGVRLGLILSLAILPVGVMGVMQSADLVTEARAHMPRLHALASTTRKLRPFASFWPTPARRKPVTVSCAASEKGGRGAT